MAVHRTRRGLLRWFGAWLGISGSGALGAAVADSRDAQPPGADAVPVEVSLAGVAPGDVLALEWQGRVVFVRRRTAAEIARERAVPLDSLRDPESDQARARRAEWVVVEGVCTHGGCIPDGPLGDYGGWYCLCHGSQFDTAGRVRAGPARQNLKVPPHEFVGELTLRVGAR